MPHGQFGNWLEFQFAWKERTARNMMQVAVAFKTANFADLTIDQSALYLLACAKYGRLCPAINKGGRGKKTSVSATEVFSRNTIAAYRKLAKVTDKISNRGWL